MAEINNRVLAALLVVAIVVSLSGTLFSLNMIRTIPITPITGYAMYDSGTANISIQSVAAILVDPNYDSIAFESGYTKTGGGAGEYNCTMRVNGTSEDPQQWNSSECGGQWNSTWEDVNGPDGDGPTPIVVYNDGNTYVRLYADINTTATEILPCGDDALGWGGSGMFSWWFQDNESKSCNATTDNGRVANYTNWRNWLNVTPDGDLGVSGDNNDLACPCLNFTDLHDSLAIGFAISIPSHIDPSVIQNGERKILIGINATDKGSAVDACDGTMA